MVVIPRARAPAPRFVLSQVRQHVATPFSLLWRKVVARVCSRSGSGLWNTLPLTGLYSTLRQAGVLSA